MNETQCLNTRFCKIQLRTTAYSITCAKLSLIMDFRLLFTGLRCYGFYGLEINGFTAYRWVLRPRGLHGVGLGQMRSWCRATWAVRASVVSVSVVGCGGT